MIIERVEERGWGWKLYRMGVEESGVKGIVDGGGWKWRESGVEGFGVDGVRDGIGIKEIGGGRDTNVQVGY